jgi:hypothetical protein
MTREQSGNPVDALNPGRLPTRGSLPKNGRNR